MKKNNFSHLPISRLNEIKALENARLERTLVREDRKPDGQRKDRFKRGLGIKVCINAAKLSQTAR